MLKTKSKVRASLLGQVVMSMKEVIKMMKETAMEK